MECNCCDNKCAGCAKLLKHITTLEAHLDIMKNSFQLAMGCVDDFRKTFCKSSDNYDVNGRKKIEAATESPIPSRKRKGNNINSTSETAPAKKSKADSAVLPAKLVAKVPSPATLALADSYAKVLQRNAVTDLSDTSLPFDGFDEPQRPSNEVAPVPVSTKPQIPKRIPVKDDIVLEAAAQTKRVYVGRVKGNQSAETIHAHLVNALPTFEKNSFRVEKVKTLQHQSSSFIIHTNDNEELYKQVIAKTTWPLGVVVENLRKNFRKKKPRRNVN